MDPQLVNLKRNSVHFSSQVPINESSMGKELRLLFKHLVSDPSTRTTDTLRTIRKSLKRSGKSELPSDQDKNVYFELFYELLGDQRWRIACECTMLMVDLMPQMSEHDLDQCMSLVLPRVVPNLGHSSTDVRRASLRLLHVYMRYTNNLQKVLRLYIKYGLQNREKPSQKGAVLSLPLLFTEEFSNENLFPLVDCLADLLVSTDTTLFYPVFLALQRIHSLVGKETFRLYLDHVRQEAVLLYQRVLSRNNSLVTSGSRSETVDISLEPPIGDKFTSIDRLIGYSEPPSSFETREDEMTSRYPFGLCYGIFPKLLIRRAESESLPDRLDALSQMVIVLQESPQTQIHLLSQHFEDFLRNFVANLIESNSYKLTLYAYDILESSIERLKSSAVNHLSLITSLLLKRLGDSRAVVREYNIKVLYRIMFSLPPQMILDSLLENKFHRNPKVREEILNRVSAGVMMFPKSEFNLLRLVNRVSPLLLDSKRCVRIAAIEAVAVLGQALGPAHIESLLRTVRSLELTNSAPGLLNAVQARLLRRELPACSPDGTIKPYINRLTCATWIPHESDADMEWAMVGSLSHHLSEPSHEPRNFNRRKSSIVLPQVSFEQPSSDSTEVAKKEGRWGDKRKASVATTSVATTSMGRKGRSKQIVSPDSSSTSESTKEREMWRYYLMSFQRNMGPWMSDDAVNSRGNHRPTSVSSNTSCDSVPRSTRRCFLDADSDAKNQRALSMPTIASGNLSDISEQSREDLLSRGRRSRGNCRRSSHRLPNSEPSSPERRLSVVDTLCIEPRSKSETGPVPTLDPDYGTLTLPDQHSSRRGSSSSIQGQNDGEQKGDKNCDTSRPASAASDMTTIRENVPVMIAERSEDTSQHCRTNEAQQEEQKEQRGEEGLEKKDAQTQMYESDSINGCFAPNDHHHPYHGKSKFRDQSSFQTFPPRRKCCRKYLSRSKSPRRDLRYHTRIQPAIASNIDIYGILENVAKTEGAFVSPEDALKAVIAAFSQDAWTTKVEAMLAISRLATYHPSILQRELHTVVQALVYEVKNLRSTVSRSAIYTLGDLLPKMKRSIEPDIDMIAQALLHKCSENTTFIKDDIEKALMSLVDEMPQTKSILSLIHGGAHHRSVAVRKTAAHYISLVVDKMGANKCLVGPRDVAEHLLPAAAKFVMDPSPVTRYYGRSVFYTVQSHPQFEKLMRRYLSPGTFRNIHGILESLKRRGPGDRPSETAIKA